MMSAQVPDNLVHLIKYNYGIVSPSVQEAIRDVLDLPKAHQTLSFGQITEHKELVDEVLLKQNILQEKGLNFVTYFSGLPTQLSPDDPELDWFLADQLFEQEFSQSMMTEENSILFANEKQNHLDIDEEQLDTPQNSNIKLPRFRRSITTAGGNPRSAFSSYVENIAQYDLLDSPLAKGSTSTKSKPRFTKQGKIPRVFDLLAKKDSNSESARTIKKSETEKEVVPNATLRGSQAKNNFVLKLDLSELTSKIHETGKSLQRAQSKCNLNHTCKTERNLESPRRTIRLMELPGYSPPKH